MSILFRYILKEYLIPLFYCLAGFIAIYLLFDLFGSFSRLVDAKLPALVIIKYFAGYLSPYFHYLAPAALMLAALYTMWNFCRHSEIIAMRASGVSFLKIAMPILFVSVLMAVFVAWVNEVYVPNNAQWALRLKREHFKMDEAARSGRLEYRNAKDGRIWTVRSSEDIKGHHLEGVTIHADTPNGKPLYQINDAHADWLDGEWWLSWDTTPSKNQQNIQHYDSITGGQIATPTPDLDKLTLRVFPEFKEKPADIMAQNRKQQFNSVAGKFRHLRTNTNLSQETRREYEFDAWKQIMAPFACILMTLFAIPSGVASGRQSVFKGVLGALGMFFLFYGFVIGGMVAANRGWMPPAAAAILPYAIFLILGIGAFKRQR